MLEKKYQDRLDAWQKRDRQIPYMSKPIISKPFAPMKDYGDDFEAEKAQYERNKK